MPIGQYSPDGSTPDGHAIVIGEAVLDILPSQGGRRERRPGGSPANVAVALAKLGRDVRLATRIGEDEEGQQLAQHFAESGVTLVGEACTSEATNTATVSEGPSYRFRLGDLIPASLPDLAADAVVVHVGSVAAWATDPRKALIPYLRSHRDTATVCFDPNIRHDAISDAAAVRQRVADLVMVSDIVKLSEDDARWIAPDTDPLELLQGWLDAPEGPSLAVVTAGGDGLVTMTSDDAVVVPAAPAKVVDTVGAGDSVTAALLDGLWGLGALGRDATTRLQQLSRGALEDVSLRATQAAAVTVSRVGADAPHLIDLTSLDHPTG